MATETKVVRAGIGPMGLLGVAFVVLKLTGVINWSWLWVTAPFWGGIALIAVIAVVVFLVLVLAEVIKAVTNRRK